MSTEQERINAVAYAIESAACKPLDEYNPQPRFNILAIAAIAAADATRPKLSDEQISRIKLDVFHIIRDYQKDTPGHTSPLAARIVEHVLEAALEELNKTE